MLTRFAQAIFHSFSFSLHSCHFPSFTKHAAFLTDYFDLREPEARSIGLPSPCFAHAWDSPLGCYSFIASPNGDNGVGAFAAQVSAQMASDAGFGGRGEAKG